MKNITSIFFVIVAMTAGMAAAEAPPGATAMPESSVGAIYTVNGGEVMRCEVVRTHMTGAGEMTIIIPDSCTAVINHYISYNDVPLNHWGSRAIDAISYAGISSGCGNGNFCPDALVTRAELAVMLQRALHLPMRVPYLTTATQENGQ